MKRLWYLLVLIMSYSSATAHIHPRPYEFFDDPIDVIIPCVEKDKEVLAPCIKSIREHHPDIRRIIVISKEKLTDTAEWFPEDRYPFSFSDIAYQIFQNKEDADIYLKKEGNRIGWVYQQLLKLYASNVIPGLSSNILCVDSDVIFLKKCDFISESSGPFFNVGNEYHKPYFHHMKRLLPGLRRVNPEYSGICHFMLFQKPILKRLMESVERIHTVPFWQAFCYCIDQKELDDAAASEYEIYFNFANLSTDQIEIHPLKWTNVHSYKALNAYRDLNYDYIACHSYLRECLK